MSPPTPAAIPADLRAGDTATWTRTLEDFSAVDGWQLDYALVKLGAQILIAAAPDGAAHRVSVPSTETAAWLAGSYTYQERASLAGQVFTTATGTVYILPNLATAPADFDPRTHAEKTLAALEAWIEHRDITVASYTIGDKQISKIPIPDLLRMRTLYRREARQPLGRSGRVYVRF